MPNARERLRRKAHGATFVACHIWILSEKEGHMWSTIGLGALIAIFLAFLVARGALRLVNGHEAAILDEAWDEAHLPGKRPQ